MILPRKSKNNIDSTCEQWGRFKEKWNDKETDMYTQKETREKDNEEDRNKIGTTKKRDRRKSVKITRKDNQEN